MGKEQFRVDDKVVIVTGGGRGLGKAMAVSLSEAGAEVCIASRTVSQLEDAAAEIEAKSGKAPLIVPTDVQSSGQCDALVAETVKHYGRLDVMLSNAGIGDRRGAGDKPWELSDDDWHDTISVNLYSTFFCARAAIRAFREQGDGGNIINVSSGTALRGSPPNFAYATAKGGVISITKGLAATLVGEGIRSNCIVPGFVSQRPSEDEQEQNMRDQRGRFLAVKRLGEAWELGPLAVFLVSDSSSYVTGETFIIDGGGLAAGIAPTGWTPEFTPEGGLNV